MRGLFITLEGIEGSGKSTQIEMLYKRLKKDGFDVIITREPGGTPIGKEIRKLLLDPDNIMGAKAEFLLYAADRAQHVVELIKPALESGKVVLADRFIDSSIAYQGYGRGLDIDVVKTVNEWVIDGCWPDLTFVLDLDVEKGLERARGYSPDNQGDRLERELVTFHRRVRQAYHQLAEDRRFIMLDADRSREEIHREIYHKVKGCLIK
ncbi:dTMP kinase [Halothermothrix orenii]|uniref:Thymidylate kinase n=1 Tax=Halothermothrix orenii (strain H 168 / OCM 544 / DSM 9562) TaxID=373903 RepID=KTHY_HALOH|nr:dTMP kinase [Halothermothrix orenii]B8CZT1.1 RecName: Full=Thymidylate kinase; AltName: Full=dTMP kinase [Halothermothrix orenii H 168]ACL70783.1 dTMP kinase [Halothermothrix orenii H 168]